MAGLRPEPQADGQGRERADRLPIDDFRQFIEGCAGRNTAPKRGNLFQVLTAEIAVSKFVASLIIWAIVFLDRYSPQQGLIWNAVNGKTAGIPTDYFVAAGALLFFLGLALSAKK
jgi:hypothetical protein